MLFRSNLYMDLTSVLTGMLDTMWRQGMFKGKVAKDAYYVICDETINDKDTEDSGGIVAQIGYADKKPAEFIVIQIRLR